MDFYILKNRKLIIYYFLVRIINYKKGFYIMKKREIIQIATERGIKGRDLESLIDYYDKKKLSKKNISILYFISCWKTGMRGKYLKKLIKIDDSEKAHIFLSAWDSGMRGKELKKLANYSDLGNMKLFHYAWESGMRGKELEDIDALFSTQYKNIVSVYINCWKTGMRGEELVKFLKFCQQSQFNHNMAFEYYRAYAIGMRDDELEKLFKLLGLGDIHIYINGWQAGLRDIELEKLFKIIKGDIESPIINLNI